jgi:DNA invertase Pin-like site-specific DNA recombinase
MFQMLGVFAEFERSIIQERVRAGLRRAKAEGKQLGRPMKARMMPRSSTPRCSKKRRSSAAKNALCTASGMVESGIQTRRLCGSKTLAKVFPLPSSTTLKLGSRVLVADLFLRIASDGSVQILSHI